MAKILMINCHIFRLASTRSKCSWHTRMSLCSSEFITPLFCHRCNNAQLLSLDIFTTISRDGEIIECFKRTREVGAIAQVKTSSTIMHTRLSIGDELLIESKRSENLIKMARVKRRILQKTDSSCSSTDPSIQASKPC